MPDITLCLGDNCPLHLKGSCYRFSAMPDYYQSYTNTFIEDGNEECEYYIEDKR